MKKSEYWILGGGILLIISVILTIYIYQNPVDDWEFCLRNMPKYNNTGKRTDVCFLKQWIYYCKLRAPSLCHDYNYTKHIMSVDAAIIGTDIGQSNITFS